ncbi:MAG: selenium-binding protein SBP56-related protein [Candidatus Methylacidiphilaceae bacterium]
MKLTAPDPTFYPSARLAMEGPREELGYVVALAADGASPKKVSDALAVVDLNPESPEYGTILNWMSVPTVGDEFHHFGWNACSSALCPYAPHPHLERRYLVIPGIRSSRIYIVDTKADPRRPEIVKQIEPEELIRKTGYTRPHTVHCGPDGIYVSALGDAKGDGPGGIFILDHFSFEPLGRWEMERGPQFFSYDFWWHINQDILVSSEWGVPWMLENGLLPDQLMQGAYGRALHVWDIRKRRHIQKLDLGENQQMVLEVRPAHDPRKSYGFTGVVLSLVDLSSSVWLWYRDGDRWAIRKVIEIPAEPAKEAELPPLLKSFRAVPPVLTDIDLSLDDRYLYLSCWGTGDLLQYDVTDPFHPKRVSSLHLGGITRRGAHPRAPQNPLNGGCQMVEVSRDGRRVYLTNSLYRAWDDQFYPEGIRGWMALAHAGEEGLHWDERFFVEFPSTHRPHQIRLQGGDCSTDSFCFP